MKICFSGSHRTGKTSLAERVAVENDFIMYYTEVSKTFKSKSVKEAERLEGIDGFYERLLIQQNINSAIKKCFGEGESYSTFDRSPIDVYAYSEYFLGKILSECSPKMEEINAYNRHLEEIRETFEVVDYTFIVQPGINFENVSSSCSEDLQEEMNDVFLNIVEADVPKNKFTVVPRSMVDFEERVEFCSNILKRNLRY